MAGVMRSTACVCGTVGTLFSVSLRAICPARHKEAAWTVCFWDSCCRKFTEQAKEEIMAPQVFPSRYKVLIGAITLATGANMTGCKRGNATDTIRLVEVGKVRKGPEGTSIEIHKKNADAILGLNQFSHVVVLYWFHKNDTAVKRKTLQVHPRGNRSNPLTGVFATRSPRRPNLIGLSVCRIRSIKNNVIYIDEIDAFHDSPVLDLKPYIPRIDAVPNASGPKWVR